MSGPSEGGSPDFWGTNGQRVWLFALGYFLAYIPYAALTRIAADTPAVAAFGGMSGLTLLPIATMVSVATMAVSLSLLGWWQHASSTEVFGRRWPRPTRITLVSGLMTSLIIATTTLAYTFENISVLFAMLLMRGGVLLSAPLIDRLVGRSIRVHSIIASALALVALLISVGDDLTVMASGLVVLDISVYIGAYFVRLRLMSRHAKSGDKTRDLRFFVEEQLVAAPVLLMVLVITAVAGLGPVGEALAWGLTSMDAETAALAASVGFFSQLTGIFGGLVLLAPRGNSYCVPLNRASSVLAGVTVSALLMLVGFSAPSAGQLWGAAVMVVAVLVLAWAPRRARQGPAAPQPAQSTATEQVS